MTFLNKQASRLIDRSLQRKDRNYTSKIESFNEEAVALHKRLARIVEPHVVATITEYVDAYIPHSNVWYVKFKSNLQNLEVATMQMLHLTFVMPNVVDTHTLEWRKFKELQEQFPTLSDFAETQFSLHYDRVKNILEQQTDEC